MDSEASQDHMLMFLRLLHKVSLWTAVLIMAYLVFWLTISYALHPLAGVPGPRLAALSNLWYARHARNGNLLQLSKSLHKSYGPVVRVGPNEVWFDSEEAFRSIYGSNSGFEKSNFYLAMALNKPTIDSHLKLHPVDTLDLLAERDMKRYRLQRRAIGTTYHTANLKRFEPVIDEVLDQVVARLVSLGATEVNLKEWMHIITVECLGAVVLSWSPGFLRDMTDHGSSGQSYLGWKRRSVFGLFPWMAIIESYSKTLGRLFAHLWGVTYRSPETFKSFFPRLTGKVSKRITAALRPNPPKDARRDLLADLIQLHRDRPLEFTEGYLRRMAVTNFGAGHETTTSALTAVLAMLGTHTEVQSRASEEVLSALAPPTASPQGSKQSRTGGTGSNKGLVADLTPGASSKVHYKRLDHDTVLQRLSYTLACIKEAQRLYPVIGMSLPRTVPATGLRVHGHYFPPGTTVGCSPASLHRNAAIFGDDAEEFRPGRWLEQDLAGVRRMERVNLTWGGGARTCPGRHLAELILYKVVARLILEFDIVATMPPDSEIRWYFMAMLTGVKVRFFARHGSPHIPES